MLSKRYCSQKSTVKLKHDMKNVMKTYEMSLRGVHDWKWTTDRYVFNVFFIQCSSQEIIENCLPVPEGTFLIFALAVIIFFSLQFVRSSVVTDANYNTVLDSVRVSETWVCDMFRNDKAREWVRHIIFRMWQEIIRRTL